MSPDEQADMAEFDFEHGELLEVLWIDSTSTHGWHSHEDELDTEARRSASMHCRSVGYLVLETPDCVILTESVSGSKSIGCTITIPRIAIRSTIHLKDRNTFIQTTGTWPK